MHGGLSSRYGTPDRREETGDGRVDAVEEGPLFRGRVDRGREPLVVRE